MSDELKVCLVQQNSIDDAQKNLQFILDTLFSQNEKVDLVCFPENTLYQRIIEGEKIPSWKVDDSIFNPIADWSKKNNSHVFLGSVPIQKNDKVYNSTIWFDASGERQSAYEKIHLFDIQLQGQKPIRESDVFTAGSGSKIVEINGWKIGLSICYDLRFSELYLGYAKKAVDLVLVPSSFLVQTGQAHWEVLLRARAIECQSYVIASAQVGPHQSVKSSQQRNTFGHALVVDPWGEVLCDLGSEIGARVLTLKKTQIQKIRQQIPMAQHRRL